MDSAAPQLHGRVTADAGDSLRHASSPHSSVAPSPAEEAVLTKRASVAKWKSKKKQSISSYSFEPEALKPEEIAKKVQSVSSQDEAWKKEDSRNG